jgi:hypothetical protein
MIKIKVGNKAINFPTAWTDLTYRQYMGVMDSSSTLETMAVFLDIPDLRNKTIKGLEDLLIAAEFLTDQPTFETYYSKIGPYDLPANHKGQFDIRFESLGQFEDMRRVMMDIKPEDGKSIMQAYGKVVPIYLQKIRDKEYDPAKVPELEAEIQNYRAVEVIGLGQFFFLKLMLLSSGTKKTSQATTPSPKKSKRGSPSSKRYSGRTRR